MADAAESMSKRGRMSVWDYLRGRADETDDERERRQNAEETERRKKAIEDEREQKERRKRSGEASIMLGRRG